MIHTSTATMAAASASKIDQHLDDYDVIKEIRDTLRIAVDEESRLPLTTEQEVLVCLPEDNNVYKGKVVKEPRKKERIDRWEFDPLSEEPPEPEYRVEIEKEEDETIEEVRFLLRFGLLFLFETCKLVIPKNYDTNMGE